MESGSNRERVDRIEVVAIGHRHGDLRVGTKPSEDAMKRSLLTYGQVSPIVVYEREGRAELIDGFKRVSASRALGDWPTLAARWIDVSEAQAKAAMYCLNRIAGRPRELEEARIVCSLVREDGLLQSEVAALLGRHKSWVCRRLALIERLCPAAQEQLQLGLLPPTAARALSQLPAGNQAELLETVRREQLTSSEIQGVVALLRTSPDAPSRHFLLGQPREALAREKTPAISPHDSRLSKEGNRALRKIGLLLEQLPHLENWLRHRGRTEFPLSDYDILRPALEKLESETLSAAEAVRDFLELDERS